VFLYKDKEGKFGTIGINKEDCQRPKYKKFEDLVREFNKNYKQNYTSWMILDAEEIFPNAIYQEGNYRSFLD